MPSGPPLFMLSGIHVYRELAKRLRGRCSSYGVFTRRELGAFVPASGFHSIEDLARDYLAIIRSQQPAGPYRLLGYSFAGIVAYELAQQLRRAGEEVRLLALVDTGLPEWLLGWRYRVSQIARLWSAPRRDVVTFAARRLKLAPPGADSLRYRDDKKLGPLEQRRDDANRAAAAHYMPGIRPFAGDVTLIVSGERLRTDPLKSRCCGWSPYVPSLDVHTVDVHHLHMLSDDSSVSEIAQVIAKQVQRAEAPRGN